MDKRNYIYKMGKWVWKKKMDIIIPSSLSDSQLSKLGLFRGKEKAAMREELEKLTKRREQLKKELNL